MAVHLIKRGKKCAGNGLPYESPTINIKAKYKGPKNKMLNANCQLHRYKLPSIWIVEQWNGVLSDSLDSLIQLNPYSNVLANSFPGKQ